MAEIPAFIAPEPRKSKSRSARVNWGRQTRLIPVSITPVSPNTSTKQLENLRAA